MKTIVWVTHLFEGFHSWPDAPDDVSFLRNNHRHVFDVKLGVEVSHSDRDVEFFQLQRKVAAYVDTNFKGEMGHLSCEMIAKKLLVKFDACFVEVSEDGENGAIVEKD